MPELNKNVLKDKKNNNNNGNDNNTDNNNNKNNYNNYNDNNDKDDVVLVTLKVHPLAMRMTLPLLVLARVRWISVLT